MTLNADEIRAYLDRPWGLFEVLRDQAWGEELRRHGSARAIALSWHLGQVLRMQHPDWPSAEDRRQDLADHVRLKEILDRASRNLESRLGS